MRPKKANKQLPAPEITDLGNLPTAEEKIRERAVAQGMDPREIEILLDEIREARKSNLKSTDDP